MNMKRLFLVLMSMLLTSAVMAQVDRAEARLAFAPASVAVSPQLGSNQSQLHVIDSLVEDFIKVPVSDRYLVITSYVASATAGTKLSTERQKQLHEQFNSRLRRLGHRDAHAVYREQVVVDDDQSLQDQVSLMVRYLNLPSTSVAPVAESAGQSLPPTVASETGAPYGYTAEGYRILGYRVVSVDTLGVKQRPQVAQQPTVIEAPKPDDALQQKPLKIKENREDSVKSQRLRLPHVEWPQVTSRFALKTNLLYDAALVPNLGLEFSFDKHWSVSADWMYAWWSKESSHRYWRWYGGNAEVRYWFGSNVSNRKFTGHHLGTFVGMLTYDVEFGGKGYQGAKWNYMAGVSYGYSLPIAKRLNLDFNLGLGYLWGNYYEYDYNEDAGLYFWQQTKKRKWFGPTRLECSLVWLLGK